MTVDESTPPAPSITMLIERANLGDDEALNRIFTALYPELHNLARSRLRRTAPFTLLDTTALLHESYLRLVKIGQLKVENRAHFLAYAARTMRSIVVDFARSRLAERRGGGVQDLVLDTEIASGVHAPEEEIVRVHDALDRACPGRRAPGARRRDALLRRPHRGGDRQRPGRHRAHRPPRLGEGAAPAGDRAQVAPFARRADVRFGPATS